MLASFSTADPPGGRPPSRAQVAEALGMTPEDLARYAAARRGQALDAEDLPHVPIVEGPARGYHYRLDAPGLSHLPPGAMRIGAGRPDGGGTGHAAGPGRLEGRLAVRHPDEVLGERVDATRKPAPRFKPRRCRKKDRPA
jgi:hypothetical protein